MAVGDNNNPPPALNMDKPFGVTNIKAYVPLVLDLDQLNYDAWYELFTSHCHSFGVQGFLDGTITSTSANEVEWKKLDSLVKVWIYGTISTSLLQTVLKKNVSARDVWKSLEDLFHDNKEARAMELHEELRSMELGNMSIAEYFKKIKVASDLLSNIESPIDDKNLVMYAVNGLGDKYEHVASIIRHSKNPLTLLETRSMLLLEESRLNRKQHRHGSRDTTSSPTVLVATSNNTKNNNNNKQVCRNFQRGACHFEKCRYLHVASNGDRPSGSNLTRSSVQQWSNMGSRNVSSVGRLNRNPRMGYQPDYTSQRGTNMFNGGQTSNVSRSRGILGPFPSNGHQAAFGPTGPNWGPRVVYGPLDEATALPQSFNAMTVQEYGDPSWYMDTGATSHLASDAGSMDPPPASPM